MRARGDKRESVRWLILALTSERIAASFLLPGMKYDSEAGAPDGRF